MGGMLFSSAASAHLLAGMAYSIVKNLFRSTSFSLQDDDVMKKLKFQATIESAGTNGACILFPYDTEKEFNTRGQVRVKATFDGVAYSGSLIKYGRPQHILPVLKAIREQIGKGPGDAVHVVIERDESVRTVEVPAPFARLLKKKGLLADFEKLSFTHRKEYCRWISEAKKEETRQARTAKAIEMLRKGIKTPG
jgi:Domain of unknown function (DUF1905)/Bacteriocin-protection, YdeI or OmpD-Associated